MIFANRSVDQLIANRRTILDAATREQSAAIVADVRDDSLAGAVRHAARLDGFATGDSWHHDGAAMAAALARIPSQVRRDLSAAAERIGAFARAQRAALADVDVAVPGGRAGHTVRPVEVAGCYAPAGRYPLPSSLLMGVVTARAAGVKSVWVATPRPDDVMLAAAAIAGADGVLGFGGAQAIAALAFGVGPNSAADVVVGPGNRWVTAAKLAVSDRVGIDFLAGPSELVVLADRTANPATIAADLLAQAEHDVDALPILVSTDGELADAVRGELVRQLATLPTAAVATASLARGGVVECDSIEAAIAATDRLAPEHLQLSVSDAESVATRIGSAGAIFLGEASAEVYGDYGAGPNHVLPTGGGARFTAGLSVFTFLRARSWLRLEDPAPLLASTARLARLEGLEAHARAAELRLPQG